ncbi:MAG: phosphatidylinositol-specific phospholipase C/glycerophosphodiester phosphodiesterase family protein [Myxococcales bacterium]
MLTRALLLVSGLLAIAAGSSFATVRALRAVSLVDGLSLPASSPPRNPLLFAHSHNDYVQPRPLADALDSGVHSVEADVFLHDGEVRVSHLGLRFVGTLRELYLEPLQARVSASGSVLGDGERFLLWIDLKTGEPALLAALHDLLSRYPMLARGEGGAFSDAPVLAVLTGDEDAKRAYASAPGVRFACRDSNEFRPGEVRDPHHLWYALDWSDWFGWDGSGPMPDGERNRLRALVAAVHRAGRKVRFYAAPDTEPLWEESLGAGVDLVGTEKLQRIRSFLTRTPSGVHDR